MNVDDSIDFHNDFNNSPYEDKDIDNIPNKKSKGSNEPSPKLFIGGISPLTTQETLKNYFLQFGELIDCSIMLDKNTNKGRGFAFVTYKDAPTANFVST